MISVRIKSVTYLAILVVSLTLIISNNANTVFDQDESDGYNSDALQSILDQRSYEFSNQEPFVYEKRSCVRRGGICDRRPDECCSYSSCRCSLWGSNCRCQRVGLFQRLG